MCTQGVASTTVNRGLLHSAVRSLTEVAYMLCSQANSTVAVEIVCPLQPLVAHILQQRFILTPSWWVLYHKPQVASTCSEAKQDSSLGMDNSCLIRPPSVGKQDSSVAMEEWFLLHLLVMHAAAKLHATECCLATP